MALDGRTLLQQKQISHKFKMMTFRTSAVHKLVSQRRLKCANKTERKLDLVSWFGVLASQSYMGNQNKFFKIS